MLVSAPVVLRIKLRYDDVETLVLKFSANVGKSGLFLPTKSIQPIGTEIKFELRLANDTPVLVGLGTVRAAREPDPANPKAAFGIAVELVRVTREGREVILKMLERRRQLGLPEVNLPMPDDVDTARRAEVEHTSVRDTQYSAREMPLEPGPPLPGDSLLTAPRRTSGRVTGAIGIAKRESADLVVAPLAAEPARRPRPRVSEIIARAHEASGAASAAVIVPGLDEDVDVPRAMARARVLAASAGDLDAELAALRDGAAAPLAEISIEAASAELARQLGGAPVRRDRSAGWAPPPRSIPEALPEATPELVVGAVSMPVQAIEMELESAPVHAAPAPAPEAAAAADEDEEVGDDLIESEAAAEPGPSGILIHDDADPSKLLRAVTGSVPLSEPDELARALDAADLGDELDPDVDDDDDRGEHTQVGAMPMAPEGYETQPATVDADELAARLEAHLADAEAEADADDEDLAPPVHDRFVAPSADAEYETAPAEADDLLAAPPEELDELAAAEAQMQTAAAAAEQALADEAEPDSVNLDDIEEIDDFEILAEADADDADLLAADGESEMSGSHPIPVPPMPHAHAPEHLDDFEDEPPVARTMIAPIPTSAQPSAIPRMHSSSGSRPVALPGMTPAPAMRANERRPTATPTSDFDFSALDLGDDSRADLRPAPRPRMHSQEIDMGDLGDLGDLAGMVVPESAEDAGFDRPISYPVDETSQPDAHEFDAPVYARPPARSTQPPIVPRLSPARTSSPPPMAAPIAAAGRPPRAARAGLDLDSALDALDDDDVNIDFDDDAPKP